MVEPNTQSSQAKSGLVSVGVVMVSQERTFSSVKPCCWEHGHSWEYMYCTRYQTSASGPVPDPCREGRTLWNLAAGTVNKTKQKIIISLFGLKPTASSEIFKKTREKKLFF